jgi:pimeloyl-ACP methyl ester carboxylesterase
LKSISRRRVVAFIGAVSLVATSALSLAAETSASLSQVARGAQPLIVLVPPNPSRGFQFSYLLKLPLESAASSGRSLLVETNNTGGLSDDLALHARGARFAIEQGLGASVADCLKAPLLMPVFPRSKSHPLEYTHALDRDTILSEDDKLKRLDNQLVAMVDDAIERLRASGYTIQDRVLLVGFSASGTFANRFSLLHPNRVAAIAIGGINGIAMLPQDQIDGTSLPYPIGTADFAALSGEAFDLRTWRQIPQFLFMGARDDNDAAQFDDAYSEPEKVIVRSVMGAVMLPTRWTSVERLYKSAGANVVFKTYPNIGHGTDRTINNDVAAFLKQWSGR